MLKSCLRISNQHLSSATLSAIQAYIPLITQPASPNPSTDGAMAAADPHAAHNLRHALLAFLPSGGVIDRLGEAREVTRTIARETIVILGSAALRLSGANPTGSLRGKESLRNHPEVPFAPFEKFIKELGTGSKVWRVREQVTRPFIHSLYPRYSLTILLRQSLRLFNCDEIIHVFLSGRSYPLLLMLSRIPMVRYGIVLVSPSLPCSLGQVYPMQREAISRMS